MFAVEYFSTMPCLVWCIFAMAALGYMWSDVIVAMEVCCHSCYEALKPLLLGGIF